MEQKATRIQQVLDEAEDVDLWQLRGLALTPGGLVNGMKCAALLL